MEDNINITNLPSLPKDMKFILLAHLDAQSLGRLMQTSKSFSKLPTEIGLWKHNCLTTWKLSPESKIQIFFWIFFFFRLNMITHKYVNNNIKYKVASYLLF